MSIEPNRWTRRRRLFYSGIVLAALALLVWVLPRKEKGRVTLSFVAYTNSPTTVTLGQQTFAAWLNEAIVELRNGTSDPIEVSPGFLAGSSPNIPFYPSTLGLPSVLIRPGQSTNLVVSSSAFETWYAEISYERRSLLDRQLLRIRNSGNAPLQFLSRISPVSSGMARSAWITNKNDFRPPPRHNERLEKFAITSAPRMVFYEPPQLAEPEPQVATGPIADAADATGRAVRAANDLAQKQGFERPFRAGNKPAAQQGPVWVWRAQLGTGKGDLEAAIRLNADGSIDDAIVWALDSTGRADF
jgi:hypothetical protein